MLDPEAEAQAKEVTPAAVTEFYRFRDRVNGCKNLNELLTLARVHGIELGLEEMEAEKAPSREIRKSVMERHHEGNYPHANSKPEHRLRLLAIEGNLQRYLQKAGSKSYLYSFGSHALGQVNSFLTDFDGLLAVPKDPNEAAIIRGLAEDAGLIFSDELNHFEDIDEIARTGRGLARMYAMSKDGIEVEFHVIGLEDVMKMHTISHQFVTRIRPVSPKLEERRSFRVGADKASLPKDSEHVFDFDVRGTEVYRGFFPEGLLVSNIVYDGSGANASLEHSSRPSVTEFRERFRKSLESAREPEPRKEASPNSAEGIRDDIWMSNVKAFLYNNGFYQELPDGRVAVMDDEATFDNFFTTLFCNDRQRYAPSKLRDLEAKYNQTVDKIAKRYDMVRVHRALPRILTSEGVPESQAIQKLHELRKNGVDLIGMDYDGTLYGDGGAPDHQRAAMLVAHIMHQGKTPFIVTARDATIRRDFVGPLKTLLAQSGSLQDKPIYLSTANGRAMYQISDAREHFIYDQGLNADEVLAIAEAYASVRQAFVNDLSFDGMERSLKQDWTGFIPDARLNVSRQNQGVWAETAKVTLLLPKDPTQMRAAYEMIKRALGDQFDVMWGGRPLVDVTKRLSDDGKRYAMNNLMGVLSIPANRAATFGDTPTGNDAGLLSFEYSFTNDTGYQRQGEGAPYVLEGTKLKPVDKIHRAIQFLLK